MFVFSGIFNVVGNDDQLTFVLAHEMSHVLLLHTVSYNCTELLFKSVLRNRCSATGAPRNDAKRRKSTRFVLNLVFHK